MKKLKNTIWKDLFATLTELQSGTTLSNPMLDLHLRIKLHTLSELASEVPAWDMYLADYWEQIEEETGKMYEYTCSRDIEFK